MLLGLLRPLAVIGLIVIGGEAAGVPMIELAGSAADTVISILVDLAKDHLSPW